MTPLMTGFDSEVFDSQTVFRHLLEAMAYPGTILGTGIPLACPERIFSSAGALMLTLMDFETPFWTDLGPDSPEVRWLKFHTGAPLTFDPFDAAFVLITDTSLAIDLNRFNPGTVISPDQSTTLVIQTGGMAEGGYLRLTGPGIPKQANLTLMGIAPDFWKHRTLVNQAAPTGIDMIFVHKDRFCALPRTVQTEIS